jgi:hypothetical protein
MSATGGASACRVTCSCGISARRVCSSTSSCFSNFAMSVSSWRLVRPRVVTWLPNIIIGAIAMNISDIGLRVSR